MAEGERKGVLCTIGSGVHSTALHLFLQGYALYPYPTSFIAFGLKLSLGSILHFISSPHCFPRLPLPCPSCTFYFC